MEYLYPVKPEMFRVIAGGQTVVILFEKYIVYKAILDKEQSMKKMAIAGNRIRELPTHATGDGLGFLLLGQR